MLHLPFAFLFRQGLLSLNLILYFAQNILFTIFNWRNPRTLTIWIPKCTFKPNLPMAVLRNLSLPLGRNFCINVLNISPFLLVEIYKSLWLGFIRAKRSFYISDDVVKNSLRNCDPCSLTNALQMSGSISLKTR